MFTLANLIWDQCDDITDVFVECHQWNGGTETQKALFNEVKKSFTGAQCWRRKQADEENGNGKRILKPFVEMDFIWWSDVKWKEIYYFSAYAKKKWQHKPNIYYTEA